jgi:hypothetical protein
MKTEDLAWLAGFIDGDGCIGIYCTRSGPRASHPKAKDYTHYQPRITIGQKNGDVLDEVRRLVGAGSVSKRGTTSAGNMMRQWVLTGEPAKELLAELVPFLRAKKHAAYRAMLGV